MEEKTFEAEVQMLVFARVYVNAKDLQSAKRKIRQGAHGVGSGNIEFEASTAEFSSLESIKET